MLIDWDAHMATLSNEERNTYAEIRAQSNQYTLPRLESAATEIDPDEFPAILMAAALKAEEKYRIPKNEGPVPFEDYEKYVRSFKSRFKNRVKVWYPHAALHVQDVQNSRRGHFRLRPEGFYGLPVLTG